MDIQAPPSCWNWQAACLVNGGYGAFRLKGKTQRAHRIAYFLMKGELIAGLELLHSCNNPKCCNPAHLRQGTHTENMQQIHRDGRAAVRGANYQLGLSEVQLLDILTSTLSARSLARKYGVDHKTILRFKKELQVCPQE